MCALGSLWWWSACTAIELADDGLNDLLQLLLLSLEVFQLCILMRLHPLNLLLHRFLNGLLVVVRQLASKLLLVADLVLQRVGIALQLIAGVDPLLQLLVFVGKALGVIHHALNVLWREAVLVICDCDFVLVACTLVLSGHTQNTIDVNLKGDFDLGYTTWGRRDASEIEGAQQVVVFGKGTLT